MPTRVLTSYARDRSGYAVCIVQIGVFLFRADVGGVQRLRVCDAAGCNARRMYLLQADQDNFFFSLALFISENKIKKTYFVMHPP